MTTDTAAKQSAQARSVPFDIVRIIAAVLVVIGHFSFSSHSVGRTPMHSSVLTPVSMYFYVTVDIFFVVSGYFILMTALNRDVRSYMVARLARLYPPLIACATLTYIGSRLLGAHAHRQISLWDWLGNITGLILIPGIGQKIQVADVVYWTIQIEWVFYFLVGLGLLIGVVQLRLMIVFMVVSLLTTLAWRHTGFSIVLFATQWLSRFAVGGMLFLLSRQPRSPRLWMLFVCAVILMLAGVWQRAVDRVHLEHSVFNPWISCSIMLVATAILAWFALHPTQTARPLIEFAGGVTFPLYLIHHQLGCAIATALGIGDSVAGVLAMTALMLVLASLIHGLAERPNVPRLRRLLNALILPKAKDTAA